MERPNIIVYLVDTLRPDHLSIHGYGRETSPRLDSFASDAVFFERAYAPSSWTKPSVVSALSGLHPLGHGVTNEHSGIRRCRLMAEYLKPEGYATAAFVTNPWISTEWGFDAGFDLFDDTGVGWDAPRSDRITHRVLDYVEGSVDRPFFIFVHTMDPHHPYDPPAEYAGRWPLNASRSLAEIDPLLVTSETSRDLIEDMARAYDAEILFNDAQFGRLLDGLRALDLYEETLIVFLSDHGEEFQEHGAGHHGSTLYEEVIRVPLLIKFPANALGGTRHHPRVSIMDILPTTLSYLGIDPGVDLDGADLLAQLAAPALASEERDLFFHLNMEKGDPTGVTYRHVARAVLTGSHKYIDVVSPEPAKAQMLFELSSDPRERDNLASSSPRLAARLAALVEESGRAFDSIVELRLAGGASHGGIRSGIAGEMTTDGQFYDLRVWRVEKENMAELSEDRRSIVFRMKTHAPSARSSVGASLGDEDGLSFRVDPPDARLTIERLTWDREGASSLFVGSGTAAGVSDFPWTVSANSSDLLAPDPWQTSSSSPADRVRRPQGVYLTTVYAFDRQPAAKIPDELRRRLESLGYVGE